MNDATPNGSDALTMHVPAPLATVRELFEAALQERGFGVLTEIDVQGVMKKKLDADHEAHRILGVCSPAVGKGVLDHDRALATLLPCSVSLREVDGGTEVRVQDPIDLFDRMAPEALPALRGMLDDARAKLEAAVGALHEGA
ncbi:MAG: DUF302 domain-containing protein [Trueperaceae bacterium]